VRVETHLPRTFKAIARDSLRQTTLVTNATSEREDIGLRIPYGVVA
jgi:hypothetical protein